MALTHRTHCSQPVLPPSRTCDRAACREERLRLARDGSGEVERLRRLWTVRARNRFAIVAILQWAALAAVAGVACEATGSVFPVLVVSVWLVIMAGMTVSHWRWSNQRIRDWQAQAERYSEHARTSG